MEFSEEYMSLPPPTNFIMNPVHMSLVTLNIGQSYQNLIIY